MNKTSREILLSGLAKLNVERVNILKRIDHGYRTDEVFAELKRCLVKIRDVQEEINKTQPNKQFKVHYND